MSHLPTEREDGRRGVFLYGPKGEHLPKAAILGKKIKTGGGRVNDRSRKRPPTALNKANKNGRIRKKGYRLSGTSRLLEKVR